MSSQPQDKAAARKPSDTEPDTSPDSPAARAQGKSTPASPSKPHQWKFSVDVADAKSPTLTDDILKGMGMKQLDKVPQDQADDLSLAIAKAAEMARQQDAGAATVDLVKVADGRMQVGVTQKGRTIATLVMRHRQRKVAAKGSNLAPGMKAPAKRSPSLPTSPARPTAAATAPKLPAAPGMPATRRAEQAMSGSSSAAPVPAMPGGAHRAPGMPGPRK